MCRVSSLPQTETQIQYNLFYLIKNDSLSLCVELCEFQFSFLWYLTRLQYYVAITAVLSPHLVCVWYGNKAVWSPEVIS